MLLALELRLTLGFPGLRASQTGFDGLSSYSNNRDMDGMETDSRQADLLERLRLLPAMPRLLEEPALRRAAERIGRDAVVAAAREELGDLRAAILSDRLPAGRCLDPPALARKIVARAGRRSAGGIRRAINATGVILHTGLGRAVLAPEVLAALHAELSGYATVEMEIENGKRGRRDAALAEMLATLLPCEDATAVNNNAGAMLLALAALARGKEVVVSRGQLVEIGGSFRMPDVMLESGVKMVEVGTTNRTNLKDYEKALTSNTGLLLLVHTSNFRVVGFTQEVGVAELAELGRRHGLPVVHDAGSGALLPGLADELRHEPIVQASLKAGADVVLFSGDKILGGPQAGIAAGKAELIERLRGHPLYRALRVDKLALRALETTLALYFDPERRMEAIPTLRMLRRPLSELIREAERLARKLAMVNSLLDVETARDVSRLGSGSLPERDLSTCVVQVRHKRHSVDRMAAALREHEPPIFARIQSGMVLLDPRTLLPGEEDEIVRAFGAL
ncbi:MAG: L-seryl-tRNA(Sec) selenium transferase [Planctomycetota bacterium]|nr:L-seryl-tRNA(Sec) selenium transferase [Planctomycetota bacterium]